ncbi:MAG TPA: alpha/beta fold hydrolase [Marmoricola sp.]|jgi:pimeloyl-ACP methyl ester carboxylesterase|nr:alpha/beta fold hydrolase [Marmoricola sp.]
MDHVTTPDGLHLEVLTMGPEDGYPFLFHSGTPSAAVVFEPFRPILERLSLRLITYSRPGYGTSTPRPERSEPWTVADDVVDSVAVLDEVGAGEFVTLGWSGGGPRALACAALLPERCRAAVSFAGLAPYDAPGLDWFAGMGPENVRDFTAATEGREVVEPLLAEQVAMMANVTAAEIVASFGQLVDSVDAGALTGELAEYLAASFRRATAQGVVGLLDDSMVLAAPWGFDLRAIDVPVGVWQGAHDLMVPFGHGRWLAATIPGARVHLFDDEGHVSLVHRFDEMLAELRELAGAPPPD